MKVCAISDLHGYLPDIPPCDLLLIGGDICPLPDHTLLGQARWLETTFRAWLEQLPMPVAAVWGNHDLLGEQAPFLVPSLPWNLLLDSALEVGGLKVYGSPWQPRFFDWAFNLDESDLARKWSRFPDDTDILLLHGPPLGYGDLTPRGEHAGSPSLRDRIFEVRPRLAVFGHIHPGRGQWTEQGVTFVNATLVDDRYAPIHPPWLIDLDRPAG